MQTRFAALLAAFLALAFWVAVPGPGAAQAQDAATQSQAAAPLTAESYAEWDKVAERAEEALDSGGASTPAFEELRLQLVAWRTRFQAEQSRDSDRIRMLETQIASLGPPPAEGETESEELAARRNALNTEYQQRVTPVRRAEEAYAQAEGLIQRIDRLLRERQAAKLLQRNPSPLVPSNWLIALSDLHTVVRIVTAEISSSLALEAERTKFRDNVGGSIAFLLVALLLLLRGRTWFKRLVDWTIRKGAGSGRAIVVAMVVSAGQFILPTIGIVLLTVAALSTSLFGPEGERLLVVLPQMGFAFFFARWLGGQSFPRSDDWPKTLNLTQQERVRGRFYTSALGLLFPLAILFSQVASQFPVDQATAGVLALPVIALAAICLGGLSRLMISHGSKNAEPDTEHLTLERIDERSLFDRVILQIGRAGLVFAVLGPLLAIVGYTRAAVFLTLSPALSLALLAAVNFLQRLSVHVFQLFAPPGRDGAEGLWPVLVNFAILTASLPFLAMIWGVRRAELSEMWKNLLEGVTIGGTKISPTVVFVFATIFAIGYLVTRIVQAAMRTSILPRTRLDTGAQKAAVSGIGYLGIFTSAMVAVSVAGLNLSNLAIVAGALSVGVGFGLQNIVSNFVSGLILLIERPVTEGDWIEVGGVMGTVRKISVRATTVETFDRTDVIVPNSEFVSGQVTNWTRGNLSGRLILSVGVAYGTDTRKVARILQEIAEAHPLVIVNPPPLIVFQGFGADSLDFEMRVILRDINFGLVTRTELNHQIAERFAAEGIEIPFAQRDVWLRNPEALAGPPRGAAASEPPPAAPDPEPLLESDPIHDSDPEESR